MEEVAGQSLPMMEQLQAQNLQVQTPRMTQKLQEKVILYCSSFNLSPADWASRFYPLGPIKNVRERIVEPILVATEKAVEYVLPEDEESRLAAMDLKRAPSSSISQASTDVADSMDLEDAQHQMEQQMLRKEKEAVEQDQPEASLPETAMSCSIPTEVPTSSSATPSSVPPSSVPIPVSIESSSSSSTYEPSSSSSPSSLTSSNLNLLCSSTPQAPSEFPHPHPVHSSPSLGPSSPSACPSVDSLSAATSTSPSRNRVPSINDIRGKVSSRLKRKANRTFTQLKRLSSVSAESVVNREVIESAADYVDRVAKRLKANYQVTRNFVTNIVEVSHVNTVAAVNRVVHPVADVVNIRFIQPAKSFYNSAMEQWLKLDANQDGRVSWQDFLNSVRDSLGSAWNERLVQPTEAFYFSIKEEWDRAIQEGRGRLPIIELFERVKERLFLAWQQAIVARGSMFRALEQEKRPEPSPSMSSVLSSSLSSVCQCTDITRCQACLALSVATSSPLSSSSSSSSEPLQAESLSTALSKCSTQDSSE